MRFFELPFPPLIKDYFSAGAIFASSALRADIYFLKKSGKSVRNWAAKKNFLLRWVRDFITWPIGLLKIGIFGAITMIGLAVMRRLMRKHAPENQIEDFDRTTYKLLFAATVIQGSMRVFGDSLIWFAIIIAANYAFIIGGAESEAPKIEQIWV